MTTENAWCAHQGDRAFYFSLAYNMWLGGSEIVCGYQKWDKDVYWHTLQVSPLILGQHQPSSMLAGVYILSKTAVNDCTDGVCEDNYQHTFSIFLCFCVHYYTIAYTQKNETKI